MNRSMIGAPLSCPLCGLPTFTLTEDLARVLEPMTQRDTFVHLAFHMIESHYWLIDCDCACGTAGAKAMIANAALTGGEYTSEDLAHTLADHFESLGDSLVMHLQFFSLGKEIQ